MSSLRLICKKSLREAIQPFARKVNLDLVDEIGYRSVLVGFPVFTLGDLIFAMIWAQIAWTRFWVGIQKKYGPYYLVILRCLFAFTVIKRLAGRKISLVSGYWFWNYYV